MLTKDLMRNRKKDGKIFPMFVDPTDADLLKVATDLIAVFKASIRQTRDTLLENSKEIVDSSKMDAVISRGLEKLLLDRTIFDTAPDQTVIQFRENVFAKTAELLKKGGLDNLEPYQQNVAQAVRQPTEKLATDLYSDLPEFQRVEKFKAYSPERLLHRYNCAQVQGLLLHCNEVEIQVGDAQPSELRQLFKYLRFSQLLAQIKKDESENRYRILIDGPLNLFYKTQKYGMNLARFFPGVLHQDQWMLRAEVQFKNMQKYQLQVDYNSILEPYYHHFSAYTPEEFNLFQDAFQKKTDEWKIEQATDFVPLEGELYCFPDYLFQHQNGMKIPMELFHPWHASHLAERLTILDQQKNAVLLIGISKVLMKDPLVKNAVETSPHFKQKGFIFGEMPTVQKVLSILKKL